MNRSPKIQENTVKLIRFVEEKFLNDELDNESLIELFKEMGAYLNLMTPSDYAKANGMTYPGVIKGRQIEEIFGVKFVIDNA